MGGVFKTERYLFIYFLLDFHVDCVSRTWRRHPLTPLSLFCTNASSNKCSVSDDRNARLRGCWPAGGGLRSREEAPDDIADEFRAS